MFCCLRSTTHLCFHTFGAVLSCTGKTRDQSLCSGEVRYGEKRQHCDKPQQIDGLRCRCTCYKGIFLTHAAAGKSGSEGCTQYKSHQVGALKTCI